jgi:hypothetical protein
MQLLDFAALVQNYCQLSHLPPPAIDDVSFVIEPREGPPAVIAWDEERDDIVIIVPLGERPVELDLDQALELLGAAFVGQNLNGAAIGIDPGTGVLSLWRRLASEGASVERLRLDIERTCETARHFGL